MPTSHEGRGPPWNRLLADAMFKSALGAAVPTGFAPPRAMPQEAAFTETASAVDQRSCPEMGQQLEQDGVLDLAVENDYRFDPGLERIEACLDLRDHAV
jgi:hypothetical protein